MQNNIRYGFQAHLSPEFPSQIIVDVTEFCNLACVHCPHEEFTKFEAFGGRHLNTELRTWSKKLKLFIDTFVSFSYLPIRVISFLGLVISILSFLYAIAMVINKVVFGNPYPGWTTIVVLVSLLCGLILLTLGIIGEYLWRILAETRKRPNYVIDKILEDKQDG